MPEKRGLAEELLERPPPPHWNSVHAALAK